jgi:oligopeptide/dipeptide ABC transporter ATP-binding protein
VLYAGRVVEQGPTVEVFRNPKHPYTVELLKSVPVADPEIERARRAARVSDRRGLSTAFAPTGCAYATRCPLADDHCRSVTPELRTIASERAAACHFVDVELQSKETP